MPKFNVTAPTGETYEVNGPEGATEAQAIAYAQSHHAAAPAQRSTYSIAAPDGQTYAIDGPVGATQAEIQAQVLAQHPNASARPFAPRGPATEPTAPLNQRIAAAQAGRTAKPGFMRQVADVGATLQRALPGVSEASAAISGGLHVAGDMITGKTQLDPADPRGSLARVNAAAFAAARARQQGRVDELRAANPLASNLATGTGLAGQVAAALATGGESALPAMADAQAMADVQAGTRAALARFGRRTMTALPKNATAGGAFAAVNAAAQPGTANQRLTGANDAVLPGAAVGVGFPAGVDALSGAARHTLGPVVDPLIARILAASGRGTGPRPSMSSPQVRAAQAIQNAIDRDAAAGHVADPVRPLRHAGGENVAALYDVVAQSPGPGRQLMRQAIDDHGAATSAAIRSDIGSSLGGHGDYFAAQDTLRGTRAANAKPDLDEAFATPIDPAAFDQHIAPIMARLPKGAMAAARDLARLDGRNPDELGLRVVEPVGGHVSDIPGQVAATPAPTMESLHYIKKGIDQTLEPYRNDVSGQLDLSGSPDAQAQGRVRTLLGRAMRRVSPAYDRGMASWGDDSDGINALKLGRNVFSPKFDMQSEQLARLHNDMSDEARAQYQKGVGEALIAEVRRTGDIRAVRQKLGDHADEFRDRVGLAFRDNPAAFGQFIDRMQGRVADAQRDSRLMGGSPTYGRMAARADLEQESAHPLDVAADMVGTPPVRLAGKALAAALRALPRGTPRSAIMDPTANAALGRSASSPDEVSRLLTMLRDARRISAAPRLQAPAATQAARLVATQAGRDQ